MTDAEPGSSPPRLSIRRPLILAGLWLFTLVIILAEYVSGRQLDHLNGSLQLNEPGYMSGSARWYYLGTLLPLAAATVALVLQYRWMPRRSRTLAVIGLVVLAPVDLLATLVAPMLEDGSVRLANGRRFVVSPDDHPNTFLNEEVGPLGLYWRRIGTPFMPGRVQLAVSRDERQLVIVADGHLMDCYTILPESVVQCPEVQVELDGPDFDGQLQARSAQIARLTRVRP